MLVSHLFDVIFWSGFVCAFFFIICILLLAVTMDRLAMACLLMALLLPLDDDGDSGVVGVVLDDDLGGEPLA